MSYRLFAVDAQAGVTLAVSPVLGRMVENRVAGQAELDALGTELAEAFAAGVGVWAFMMVVASGRVPD